MSTPLQTYERHCTESRAILTTIVNILREQEEQMRSLVSRRPSPLIVSPAFPRRAATGNGGRGDRTDSVSGRGSRNRRRREDNDGDTLPNNRRRRTANSDTGRNAWAAAMGPQIVPWPASTSLPNMNSFDWANFLRPVPVVATEEEINMGSTLVTFSDIENPEYHSCPISHETFSPNSRTMRFNGCGHYFSEAPLRRWLRTSVSCPLCRYDIRGNTSGTTPLGASNGLASPVNLTRTPSLPSLDASGANPLSALLTQIMLQGAQLPHLSTGDSVTIEQRFGLDGNSGTLYTFGAPVIDVSGHTLSNATSDLSGNENEEANT